MLTRHGIEVVLPPGQGCCGGARPPHGPRARGARGRRAATSTPGSPRSSGEGLDAILITASGCGTTVKDYGFMLRTDPAYAGKAAARLRAREGHLRVSRRLDAAPRPACAAPRRRLSRAPARCSTDRKSRASRRNCFPRCGFVVKDVPEGHLCCGSAGTYNILQPDIAKRLRARKVGNIEKLEARCDRRRQYRLHHADRGRHGHPGRPSGRADRLGDRRAMSASATGPSTAYGDAVRVGRLSVGARRRLGLCVCCRGRVSRTWNKNDREDDHGEEGKGEEKDQRRKRKRPRRQRKRKP